MATLNLYDLNTDKQPISIQYPIGVNGNIYGLTSKPSNLSNITNLLAIGKIDPITGNTEPLKDASGKTVLSPQQPPLWIDVSGTFVFFGITYSSNSLGSPSTSGLWKVDSTGKAVLFESTKLSNADGPRRFANLTNVDGILYFSGDRAVEKGTYGQKDYSVEFYGFEPYRLDPATGETTSFELEPGAKSSDAGGFINVNGTVYFSATTTDSGTELWKIGTDNKPQKIEILSGTDSSSPSFVKFNNTLYFSAANSATGRALYKIDTATGNPVKVADNVLYPLGSANGDLYLYSRENNNDTIKRIDASDNITNVSLGKYILSGDSSSPDLIRNPKFVTVNGTPYLIADANPRNFGDNNLALVKLNPSGDPVVFGFRGGNLQKIGNDFFFVTQEQGSLIPKIQKIDLATGNSIEISTSPISPDQFNVPPLGFESNGAIVLPNRNGYLVKLDPATNKTSIYTDPNGIGQGSNPTNAISIENTTYFLAQADISSGNILWKAEAGKSEPIAIDTDAAGVKLANVSNPADIGGTLYFLATAAGSSKNTLWKIDPKAAKPVAVEMAVAGTNLYNFGKFVNAGGTPYFIATTGMNDTGIWKIGSAGKIERVEVAASGSPGTEERDTLTNINGTLYFSALSLGKLEPSSGKASIVGTGKDGYSYPKSIIGIGGDIYFTATKSVPVDKFSFTQAPSLWKIDSAGTAKEISLSLKANDNPSNLFEFKGNLHFVAQGKLWKFDRATDKAQELTGAIYPSSILKVGDNLFFTAMYSSPNGASSQLYKLDANEKAVVVGIGTSNILLNVKEIGGQIYTIVRTDKADEVWSIDPATAKSTLVGTLDTGKPSPGGSILGIQNGKLLLSTENTTSGQELWTLDLGGGKATPTNNPPVVANAIADQSATVGTDFKFVLPVNSFSDPDTGNTLTYTATLADGKTLPTWLTFDAVTQTFTGKPPEGAVNLDLRVKATDNGGLSVTDDFSLAISPTKAPVEKTDTSTTEKPQTGGDNVGTAEMNGTKTDTSTTEEPKTGGDNVGTVDINTGTKDGGTTEPPKTTTDGENPIVNLSSGGTPENPIPTNNPADGGGVVEDTPIRGNAPNQRGEGGSSPIPGITLANNLFQTSTGATGFGISAISRKPNAKVSEIALFALDDLTGKIDNLAPGSVDYLKAALRRAQPIFSTLNGSFFNSASTLREIALSADRIYQAIEVKDASLGDLQQKLELGIIPDNISYSLLDQNGKSDIAITADEDGYQIAIDAGELVLDVLKLAAGVVNTPIGAKSQNTIEGRLFDLSEYSGRTLTTNMVTNSSAQYNNQIGFYEVADSSGAIRLDDGTLVSVGDGRYAAAAIKKAIANAEFLAGKRDSKTGLTIAGGKIYAPVVVSQGNFQDFLTKNPSNTGGGGQVNAYFNYIGANSDKVDHFRLIGNNTFAVEDMHGGGDRDFNDMVVKMDFSL